MLITTFHLSSIDYLWLFQNILQIRLLFLTLVFELVEMILHNQTTKTDCWYSTNVVTHNSQCPLHLVTSFSPHWIVIFPGGRDYRLYLVSLLYTPLRTYYLDFTVHLSVIKSSGPSRIFGHFFHLRDSGRWLLLTLF